MRTTLFARPRNAVKFGYPVILPGAGRALTFALLLGVGLLPHVLKAQTQVTSPSETASQPLDMSAITSPIIFRGDSTTAYRDPAAIYNNGWFYLYFSLVKTEFDNQVFGYTAWSKSTDLVHWTEPRIFTPRDHNLNYGSPGDVIRYGDEWILCLQTYPRPNGIKYGNGDCRIWIMRSKDLENWGPPELLRVKGPNVPQETMGRMIDPYLIEDRGDPGKWWCFYKSGSAWSRDLKVWTPESQRPPGENPCVILDGSDYVMFYAPRNGVGVRRSKDLIEWSDEGVLTLGQKDWPWAKGRLTAGFVLDLRKNPSVGKALMFFHGSDYGEGDPRGGFDSFSSLGLAWSSDLKNWDWPGQSSLERPPKAVTQKDEGNASHYSCRRFSHRADGGKLTLQSPHKVVTKEMLMKRFFVRLGRFFWSWGFLKFVLWRGCPHHPLLCRGRLARRARLGRHQSRMGSQRRIVRLQHIHPAARSR